MKRPFFIRTLSSAGLALVMAMASSHAADTGGQEYLMLSELNIDEVMQLRQSGEILSLETVLRQAHDIQPGRVIEIDLDDDDNRYVYELEIVDDQGDVWDLEIDARSGKLLKHEHDD